MDVLNDRIIDIGLNVIGFIAAGLFWMVVYTTIIKNRKARVVVGIDAQKPPPDPTETDKHKPEFIDFNSMPVRSDLVNTVPSPANRTGTRRNRLEIIRIAREMIKNGADDEKIRNTLPISAGELALLNSSNRR